MQKRLSLSSPAIEGARRAVRFDLRDVATHRAPTFDLPLVVRTPAAHVVTAVPLEPATRILMIDPTVLLPHGQRLRRIHFEEIEFGIVLFGAELRAFEPRRREFFLAIS